MDKSQTLMKSVLTTLTVTAVLIAVPAAAADLGYEGTRCLTWVSDDPVYGAIIEEAKEDAVGKHRLKGPPDDPDVGDSWQWWLMVHDPYPVWDLYWCTVRGEGTNCYVVVEDSPWNVNIDSADVTAIIDFFDNATPGDPTRGTYEINSDVFGTPPDELDDDPKIYILYYDFGTTADGWFNSDDMTEGGTSNECEVVYINPATSADPGEPYLNAVVAHEFEHMIHWKYDENESSWVDEGCAELAMYLFGHPDTISGFNTNPDNDLTDWGGEWADYIQCYLWTLYFYEKYGGEDTIYALVHEPANSITGVDNTLAGEGYSEDMIDVFTDWVVANYLDNDDSGFFGGKYGYEGEDLPPFNCFKTWTDYPVDSNASVQHWASDYVKYESGYDGGIDDVVVSYSSHKSTGGTAYNYTADADCDPVELFLTFDGADNNSFGVQAMLFDNGEATDVLAMTLDGSQYGELHIADFDTPVLITHFSATGVDGGIEVTWRTVEESDGTYYNLYRRRNDADARRTSGGLDNPSRTDVSGGYVLLNDSPITGASPYSFVDSAVSRDVTYSYLLEAVIPDEEAASAGPLNASWGGSKPTAFGLARPYPNPAASAMTVAYSIPGESGTTAVELSLYDVSGRKVATLVNGPHAPGNYEVVYDATELSVGVYVCRLAAGSDAAARLVVVAR
ncbi:MAG: T9SS type A sorting domain-containing protein [Candidatus Coatesbacteria bacterium]|nr:MAG: T9SS type A sorting domain-containing protein [Candidatus Coatesbacteria bacterium]